MLDLPHAACRPRSAPDMRSRMRSPSRAPSFCFVKPVWLPRNPTRCPNTAKAPSVCTLPARSVEQTFAGAFQTRRRRGCRAQAPGRCAAASARACHPTRPHTRRSPVARPGLLHSSFCRGWTSGALMSAFFRCWWLSFKILPDEGEGKRRKKGRRKEGEEKKEKGKRKGRDPKGFS